MCIGVQGREYETDTCRTLGPGPGLAPSVGGWHMLWLPSCKQASPIQWPSPIEGLCLSHFGSPDVVETSFGKAMQPMRTDERALQSHSIQSAMQASVRTGSGWDSATRGLTFGHGIGAFHTVIPL